MLQPKPPHVRKNRKSREDCLSLDWPRLHAEVDVVIESWRQYYNAVRPHSSLYYYLTPPAFKHHHQLAPN